MRLWKLVAIAVLVIAMGQLIFLFQEAESPEISPYEPEPYRHVILNADYFPILCDILIVVILISGLSRGLKGLQFRRDSRTLEGERSVWVTIAAMTILSTVIILFYALFLRKKIEEREFLEPFVGNPEGQPGILPGVGQGAQHRPLVLSEPTPQEQFFVILLSVIIIIAIIALIVLMIKPPKPRSEEPFLITFPDYILRKKEFTFDGPPRDVVINAYGAALRSLQEKGINIPEHFTPWEFQQKLGSSHLNRLTRLFEKARYSTHDISHNDAKEALEQYMLVQNEEFEIPEQPEDDES